MPPLIKSEFPPLLVPGLHNRTVTELKQLCVTGFANSATRGSIMLGLEDVVTRLCGAALAGEIWIDGSFLTQKLDPEDVDMAFGVPHQLYDNGSPEQKQTLEWFVQSNLKSSHHCDTYIWFEYPLGHPMHAQTLDKRNYWQRHFGFSRRLEAKGIAVILIPDGAI